MENILELQRVSKTFPGSDFALDNVSFALPYGAVLGFVGENGAGKTTTIGCILNTVNRDSGTVKLFGREMSDGDTDMREKIGVVYDGNNFPVYWTPRQLSKIMGGLYKNWDAVLFEKYLDTFDLPAKQKIRHYSRGMTMKLAIAAALSHHPQLLILDEATSGLDPVVRDDMLEVFLDFVQEEDHSILLSSHITSDLEKIADYISFIHHGKIIMTVSKNVSCAAGRVSSVHWIRRISLHGGRGICRSTCWSPTAGRHSANTGTSLWTMSRSRRSCCFYAHGRMGENLSMIQRGSGYERNVSE